MGSGFVGTAIRNNDTVVDLIQAYNEKITTDVALLVGKQSQTSADEEKLALLYNSNTPISKEKQNERFAEEVMGYAKLKEKIDAAYQLYIKQQKDEFELLVLLDKNFKADKERIEHYQKDAASTTAQINFLIKQNEELWIKLKSQVDTLINEINTRLQDLVKYIAYIDATIADNRDKFLVNYKIQIKNYIENNFTKINENEISIPVGSKEIIVKSSDLLNVIYENAEDQFKKSSRSDGMQSMADATESLQTSLQNFIDKELPKDQNEPTALRNAQINEAASQIAASVSSSNGIALHQAVEVNHLLSRQKELAEAQYKLYENNLNQLRQINQVLGNDPSKEINPEMDKLLQKSFEILTNDDKALKVSVPSPSQKPSRPLSALAALSKKLIAAEVSIIAPPKNDSENKMADEEVSRVRMGNR